MARHHNEKVLAHMGVQVWYIRDPGAPGTPLPATTEAGKLPAVREPVPTQEKNANKPVLQQNQVPGQPVVQQAPEEVSASIHEPFAFRWLATDGVMLLYEADVTIPDLFVRDLHDHLIWLRSRLQSDHADAEANSARKVSGDTFRWPVLAHNPGKGSPARTVKVFFDKQLGPIKPADALIALTTPIEQTDVKWLPEGVQKILLPNLELCAVDAAEKTILWKRLQNLL